MGTRRNPAGSSLAHRKPSDRLARSLIALSLLAAGTVAALPDPARASDPQVGLCHEGYLASCLEDCSDFCYEDGCLDGYPACIAQCSTVPANEREDCRAECGDICDDSGCPEGLAACDAACRALPADRISDCLDGCAFDCECAGGYNGCAQGCHDELEKPCAPLVGLQLFLAGMGRVRPGATIPLHAFATFADGTTGVDLAHRVVWSSSDPSVATVTPDGVVTTLAKGSTTITALEPASGITNAPEDGLLLVEGPLLSIRVLPSKRILANGHQVNYRAMGRFGDGVELDLTSYMTWSVTDPTIASIESSGHASGLAPGVTTVVAVDSVTGLSSPTSGPDAAVLTVKGGVTSLAQSPPSAVLMPGETIALKARATFSDRCGQLTYTSRVRWQSSDPAIASVDAAGVATCNAPGTASISTLDRKSGVTSTASGGDTRITCGPTVKRILILPRASILPQGETRPMRAVYVLADGSRLDGTRRVTWASSDPSVIGMTSGGSKAGEARALAPGRATISAFDPVLHLASASTPRQTAAIEVPGPLQSLVLVPTAAGGATTGAPGETMALAAVASFDGGAQRPVSNLSTWASSDPTIVSIGVAGQCAPPGTVQLLRAGKATVSAMFPMTGDAQTTSSIEITVAAGG